MKPDIILGKFTTISELSPNMMKKIISLFLILSFALTVSAETVPRQATEAHKEDISALGSSGKKIEDLINESNVEYSKGELIKAFELSQKAFEKCAVFDDRTSLAVFENYIRLTGELLGKLDDNGSYEVIFDVSKNFVENIERLENIEKVIQDLLQGPDATLREEDIYLYIARGYGFLAFSYASKNNIAAAEQYLEIIRKYRPPMAQQVSEAIENFKEIFSDETLLSIYRTLLPLYIRLSTIYMIPKLIRPLYDKFRVRDINNEKALVGDLKANVDLVINEIYDSKYIIKQEYYDLYLFLMDSKATIVSARFHENMGFYSQETVRRWMGLFKCTFISLLNYIILESKGIKTFFVATKDTEAFVGLFEYITFAIDSFFRGDQKEENPPDHALCLVKLNEKNCVFADFSNSFISKSFDFFKTYDQEGEIYFELKPYMKGERLLKHFQLTDRGFMSYLYSGLFSVAKDLNDQETQNYFLKKAEYYNPYNYVIYSHLRLRSIELKQYEEAIAYAEKSIEFYKNNPMAYVDLGLAYTMRGDRRKCIDILKQTILIYEDCFDAYSLLGLVYLELNEADNAIKACKEALKKRTHPPEVYESLARAYHKKQDYFRTRDNMKKAIKYYEEKYDFENATRVRALLKELK